MTPVPAVSCTVEKQGSNGLSSRTSATLHDSLPSSSTSAAYAVNRAREPAVMSNLDAWCNVCGRLRKTGSKASSSHCNSRRPWRNGGGARGSNDPESKGHTIWMPRTPIHSRKVKQPEKGIHLFTKIATPLRVLRTSMASKQLGIASGHLQKVENMW